MTLDRVPSSGLIGQRFGAPSVATDFEFIPLREVETASLARVLNDHHVLRHMPLAQGNVMGKDEIRRWLRSKEQCWEDYGFGPWGIRIRGAFADGGDCSRGMATRSRSPLSLVLSSGVGKTRVPPAPRLCVQRTAAHTCARRRAAHAEDGARTPPPRIRTCRRGGHSRSAVHGPPAGRCDLGPDGSPPNIGATDSSGSEPRLNPLARQMEQVAGRLFEGEAVLHVMGKVAGVAESAGSPACRRRDCIAVNAS
jgi:hypothetical protein